MQIDYNYRPSETPTYRQTLLLSQYMTPEMNNFVKKNVINEKGIEIVTSAIPETARGIRTVVTQVCLCIILVLYLCQHPY